MPLLTLKHLSLFLEDELLLDNLNISLNFSEHIAILGRSGCGKSSLLKVILGLEHPFRLQGSLSCQASCAYMAQQDALLPWLSVIENVNLSQRLQGNKIASKAWKCLEQVGLLPFAYKKPYLLSGGQKQRVALARTMMQETELILMDEPFSAVDAISRIELQIFTKKILANRAMILITHDPLEALRLADKIYVIQNKTLTPPFMSQHIGIHDEITPSVSELHTQLLQALSL